MSKRIFFFAVDDDLVEALLEAESGGKLDYASIGYFPSNEIKVYNSVKEIEQISGSTHETGSISQSFLIGNAGTRFRNEKLRKDDGSVVYPVYEALNPECIRIIPAGRWNDMVLSGTVVAFHNDPVSKQLMRRINSAFKKTGFEKVNGHWLGPKAYQEFLDGKRFGDAEQSPAEYDFRASR